MPPLGCLAPLPIGVGYDMLLRCSTRSMAPRTICAAPKPKTAVPTIGYLVRSAAPVAVTAVPRIAGTNPSRIGFHSPFVGLVEHPYLLP